MFLFWLDKDSTPFYFSFRKQSFLFAARNDFDFDSFSVLYLLDRKCVNLCFQYHVHFTGAGTEIVFYQINAHPSSHSTTPSFFASLFFNTCLVNLIANRSSSQLNIGTQINTMCKKLPENIVNRVHSPLRGCVFLNGDRFHNSSLREQNASNPFKKDPLGCVSPSFKLKRFS